MALLSLLVPMSSLAWDGNLPYYFSLKIRSMVNSIVGGQVIAELSGGKCPLVVGVILIAIISLIIAVLGYKVVHYFEQISWIVMIILFCIVAGLGGRKSTRL